MLNRATIELREPAARYSWEKRPCRDAAERAVPYDQQPQRRVERSLVETDTPSLPRQVPLAKELTPNWYDLRAA